MALLESIITKLNLSEMPNSDKLKKARRVCVRNAMTKSNKAIWFAVELDWSV